MAWPDIFQRGTLLSRFSHHHVVVFLLTFFSYSLLHASRKTFSNVKVSISKQWTPSAFNKSIELPVEIWSSNHLFPSAEEATLFLGTLDTIFLFSYAVGLFISGIVGDRLNLRWVLSFGMCSSALVVFVFGTLTEWLRFYNKGLYCCLWIVNGLLQSTGWPCVVAVMGNWFGKAGRGVVFGLWSACASVGNILGACLASSVLQYGYEYAFLVTAAVQFAGGIIIFFGLLVSPEEIGLPGIEAEENFEEDSHRPLINGADNEDESEPNYSIQEDDTASQVKAISFYQACCLPGVIPYSLAYACLKLVNYSFFFWLPFYLSNNFGWKEAEADKLSIWYDVGGIIGGTLQGFISDVLQKRAPVLALSLLLAVGSLVGYSRSPDDKSINALLMAVTGFFIGGPSNMISSAISADLGRQELIQGSSEALATVTGIVDGTGSIGAAVGQYLVSLIQDNLGWIWVFYFFILMAYFQGVRCANAFVVSTSVPQVSRPVRCCEALSYDCLQPCPCCWTKRPHGPSLQCLLLQKTRSRPWRRLSWLLLPPDPTRNFPVWPCGCGVPSFQELCVPCVNASLTPAHLILSSTLRARAP